MPWLVHLVLGVKIAPRHGGQLSLRRVVGALHVPHIGRDRELKKAQEAFLQGELDEAGLRALLG